MYHGNKSRKQKNPKSKAGIFSLLTFFYTKDIFKLGLKRDIEERDIYEVLSDYRSKKLGDDLERHYQIDRTNNTEPSIFRLLWKCYGKYYLFLGLLQLIMRLMTVLLLPKALGKLVSYFTPSSVLTRSDAIYYGGIVIAIVVVNCIYSHNYMLVVTELGIRIRTAFCSLIYRKSLKLSASTLSDITIGKIVTLISKDVHSFDSAVIFANDIWIGVILLVIVTWMIYIKMGVATLAAIGFYIFVITLQVYVAKYTSKTRIETSKITDSRLQTTQETLSAIKIIKMYTWEKLFSAKISTTRRNEVQGIKKIYYAKVTSLVIGSLVTNICLYLLIMSYLRGGNHLTAELVFYILSCLNALRQVVMISIPLGLAQVAELFASIQRMNKILQAPDIRKPHRIKDPINPSIEMQRVAVKIGEKEILHNIYLKLDSGLNIISGRVGYGKSSLLKTILEDYPISQGNLRVRGSISYASEEPWVFPSTLKQNIIFGEQFDEKRYKKVLDVCALKWDISTFDMGDEIIVGDRGLNLSKGQQARVNLARAIYKNADIYLLDDCFSSLDANVQDSIFNDCIKKFLHNKIVILISHNPDHIKQADNVILMDNGTIASVKKPSELLNKELNSLIGQKKDDIDDTLLEKRDIDDSGKESDNEEEQHLLNNSNQYKNNIYHEVKKIGKVDNQVYLRYYKFGGGMCVAFLIFLVFVVAQAATSYTDKLVSTWTNVEQNLSDYKMKNLTNSTGYIEALERHSKLLNTYTIMLVASTILTLIRAIAHFNFIGRASVNLHKSTISSILNATMEFFDSHYIGNILNRFSKDLGTIDEYLAFIIYECMRLICFLAGIIILIASVNAYFLIPSVAFFILLAVIRKYYIPTGRSLKRLDSATRSPVIGHLNASLEGLTTIRASGNQRILEEEFDRHQDLYVSAYHMMLCSTRAFGFFLDILSCCFITIIVSRFVLFETATQAGGVGLAITQAFMLTGLLQWAIRNWAELESNMTSVERLLEYTDIKAETREGKTIENWPSNGEITYKNVNLTYTKSNQKVLKDINFTIYPKEKIGIVGRTGAGKSSIISTLFRLYESDGLIEIDNVDIKTLTLQFLRTSIAIIPQDPVLFTGTIGYNIDPNLRYDDAEIWKALDAVKLKDQIDNLDQIITENCINFSSGQKQLICLARAIVSNCKIIVLDEATANMDPATDAIIHETIKENFYNCTVLTVAHRLHSVMSSDRVMVVDKGEIVEFDTPKNLLNNKDGLFYKMMKQANLM